MFSTIVNSIQVFDADVLEYGDEIFYVTFNTEIDNWEGESFFSIASIKNSKRYNIAVLDTHPFKIIGNLFEGNFKVRLRHYHRDYKRRIINNFHDLERTEDEDSNAEKLRKRNSNNKIIDNFKIEEITEQQLMHLDRLGVLNLGICCPLCGSIPVTKRMDWPYQRKWSNGVSLHICKACFTNQQATI